MLSAGDLMLDLCGCAFDPGRLLVLAVLLGFLFFLAVVLPS